MKQPIRFLTAALLLATAMGCSAQKAAEPSRGVCIEHAQAVKAIEQRRFRIDIDECFSHSDKPPVPVTGSYLILDRTQGTMRLVPIVFPRYSLSALFVEDPNAVFRMEKTKKRGHLRFTLQINGKKTMEGGTALVTLYAGSNRCLIQFYKNDFRGRIYPLDE